MRAAGNFPDVLDGCFVFLPNVIILDLDSQELGADHLIGILRKLCPASLILCYSGAVSPKYKANHALDGPWASIDKSELETLLPQQVRKAEEFLRGHSHSRALEYQQEENILLEYEWLLKKESHRKADQSVLGRNILDKLTSSMFQGLGIGSLITRLELAEIFMEKQGENYRVSHALIDGILKNKNILRERLERLDTFKSLFNWKISLEKVESERFEATLMDCIRHSEEVAKIKNQTIVQKVKLPALCISSNIDFLRFAVNELMVNAVKFSPNYSRIQIDAFRSKRSLCVQVTNEILFIEGGISGIPEEYIFKVFEPFIMLNSIFDERFLGIEFGLGIGLNLIQNLAKQIDCKVSIGEILDWVDSVPRRKVSAELKFPLIEKNSTGGR
ncbi:hypothetical protein CH373_17930 [Leptospira perolatii]|uniref:Histidine kinase/HSP90-like ATPase domain-containing protein n=2 Tax=Leptospira perolatii TaxID=2023191 RepID=A0A2M9ZI57_9LEPT|nr:hypothetical protein CH360_17875 [Leptospira perolatii]PJZ71748.1 hypothetical protein CH373_17930 [Leptospira perolatii]